MIEWASIDVDHLFDLAAKQLNRVSVMGKKTRAINASNLFTSRARNMSVTSGLSVKYSGRFIGKGGINLRRL